MASVATPVAKLSFVEPVLMATPAVDAAIRFVGTLEKAPSTVAEQSAVRPVKGCPVSMTSARWSKLVVRPVPIKELRAVPTVLKVLVVIMF